jgi:hypothetical protein
MDPNNHCAPQSPDCHVGPKGWKRLIRRFLIVLIILTGLWTIVASNGGSSGGGSSSSSGTVSGSAT